MSRYVSGVPAGMVAKVSLRFPCRLSGGTDLTNRGVTGSHFGERQCLHRGIDAVMFGVQVEPDMPSGGQVDFGLEPTVTFHTAKATVAGQESGATGHPLKIVGIRPGEKLHEVMITEDDSRHTFELADRCVIEPAFAFWNRKSYRLLGARPVPAGFRYASGTNTDWLDARRLAALLAQSP